MTRLNFDFNPGGCKIQNHGSKGNLALAHKRLAALYAVTQRFDEAQAEYDQARVLDEALSASNPSDLNTRVDLSYDYSDLGWVASHKGDDDQGLEWYRRALAIREEAAAADPNNYRAASSLASVVGRIGVLLWKKGDFSAAAAQSRRAIQLYEVLAARPAAQWRDSIELAERHIDLADTYTAMRDSRAAAEYERARTLYAAQRAKGVLTAEQINRMDEITAMLARARGR